MTPYSPLIDNLVDDLRPVPRGWMTRRLAIGLCGGASLSTALALGLWGIRPDMAAALNTTSFWAKLAFTGLLAAAGIDAVRQLAQPGTTAPRSGLAAALTVAAMGVAAALQLGYAPEVARRSLVLGSTAGSCPWLIMGLAIPILSGGVWAVRAMAPTRLAKAGCALGFASGAAAAAIYALACDEVGMPFTMIWYSLGIAVLTMAGGILGPRLLRW